MSWRPLIYLLVFYAFILPTQQDEQQQQQNKRIAHRLIGGHLRIYQEDPNDTDSLIASASGLKNRKKQKSDDDEKKTLSQQVADGKYGLIQKEIFTKPIKRPGVISYDANPEIPKDNINNLGGLTKNDIWLAENHLLIIKGGHYPPHDDKKDNTNTPIWQPIDNYKAPLRQVKIPAHPKVPPPFPVQLTDDGPLQILGTNSSRTINGTTFEPSNIYAIPPTDIYVPGTNPFFNTNNPNQNQANITTGQTPFSIPPYNSGELPGGGIPPPFPPFQLNGTLPPFFASLPPGAAILPPPSNQTEQFDEDDPSIYYPPPYSFYYPKDNSSIVPPGPLVPGIILPPPPNFFGLLEDTTMRQQTTRNRGKTTTTTTTTPLPQIRPSTTPLPPTAVLDDKKLRRPINIFPPHIPAEINNELKPIVTTSRPNIVTIQPQTINRTQKPIKRPSVTVLKPVKTTSETPKIYTYNNEVSRKPFEVYGPPQPPPPRVKTVTTTQVPLKIYYSSTNDIETNSITQSPEKYRIGIAQRLPKTTTKTPAQYYYYEEQPRSVTTDRPIQTNYYDIPGRYYIPKSQNLLRQTQHPQYIYVTSSSSSSSPISKRPQFRFVQQPKRDSFSVHIARLQKQIHQYITTNRPNYQQQQQHSPKPVYQFSFQATNYHQQHDDTQDKFRPLPRYSVQIQPAVEIIPTEPTYQRSSTERPASSKYYTTVKTNYDYDDNSDDVVQKNEQNQSIKQYNYHTTPNPIYQGFYTKPDENYFDENTKEYFTTFGKKLTSTTPIPIQTKQKSNIYQPPTIQKPISLHSDTAVNYLPPVPKINPNAEFIRTQQPIVKYPPKPPQQQHQQQYRQNQGAEIVKAIELPIRDGHGSFISYQLPGDDGAHFYFLTPQLAQSRDQGAGYYYEQDNISRLRRNNNRNRSSR